MNATSTFDASTGISHVVMNDDNLMVLDGVYKTKDGYLAGFARIARTGIQHYRGKELGRSDLGDVAVYRPASEVFHLDAMRSMAHKPVTLHHPPVSLTADNWKKYATGWTGDEVLRDGDKVKVPMLVADAAAIKAWDSGEANQISVGYSTDIEWKPGQTEDGQKYDAVQTNIRGNHVAFVPAARGGADLRIGDGDFRDLVQRMQKVESMLKDDGDVLSASPAALWNMHTIISKHMSPAQKDQAKKELQIFLVANLGEEEGNEQFRALTAGLADADLSAEGRRKEAASGAAMPDGSFPIKSAGDVENAVHDWGRAGSSPAVKAHIISRAKALGAEGSLPDDWHKSTTDAIEGDFHMADNTKTIIVDGLPVTLTDMGATIVQRHINTLHSTAADLQGKLDKEHADKEAATEKWTRNEKDCKTAYDAIVAENTALKSQLADAKKAVTPAILDGLVKDRQAIVDKAKTVIVDAAFTYEGKSNEDIRRVAVSMVHGDVAKDLSDTEVTTAFKLMAGSVKDASNGATRLSDGLTAAAAARGKVVDGQPLMDTNGRYLPPQNIQAARNANSDAFMKSKANEWQTKGTPDADRRANLAVAATNAAA